MPLSLLKKVYESFNTNIDTYVKNKNTFGNQYNNSDNSHKQCNSCDKYKSLYKLGVPYNSCSCNKNKSCSCNKNQSCCNKNQSCSCNNNQSCCNKTINDLSKLTKKCDSDSNSDSYKILLYPNYLSTTTNYSNFVVLEDNSLYKI